MPLFLEVAENRAAASENRRCTVKFDFFSK
jgi:hypothetical protein